MADLGAQGIGEADDFRVLRAQIAREEFQHPDDLRADAQWKSEAAAQGGWLGRGVGYPLRLAALPHISRQSDSAAEAKGAGGRALFGTAGPDVEEIQRIGIGVDHPDGAGVPVEALA